MVLSSLTELEKGLVALIRRLLQERGRFVAYVEWQIGVPAKAPCLS